MLQYSNEQLATIIGVPIVTILLLWTVAIFHLNRKRWSSYDIAIVAILVQSILRNVTILTYTALLIVKQNSLTSDYCKTIAWIFNSIHTFQASSLTTLAVVAVFTVKLHRKQQNLHQYLTPTHIIYHLFCLTTLCACVGVAAILAQEDNDRQRNVNFFPNNVDDSRAFCKFMPFELDVKFNTFIIVLHIFLAMVTLTSFVFICLNHLNIGKQGFDYLKKSSSDLSELSLSMSASVVQPNENGKSYYDTYTIQRDGGFGANYESQVQSANREPVWNSDLSNISMTVSSTNSKRPCLNKPLQEEEEVENGLHTMYPILTVCYLFNHLPLIVLCIFPWLVAPWPVAGVALWMGQLQDVLIPVGLGLVDTRFCKWVSKAYKCTERRRSTEKIPPGVGLDGKFRHFGSQPQSLEIPQSHPERSRGYSLAEPKFPITNGSLYTSIDGRLPIIHNYRRHKDQRGCLKTLAPQSLNVNLHSSHLKRQDYVRPRFATTSPTFNQEHPCGKQEGPVVTNPLNVIYNRSYPHVNQNFVVQQRLRRDVSFGGRTVHDRDRKPLQKRISLSQDSLFRLENMSPIIPRSQINRPRLVRRRARKGGLNSRISKSEDCLNDLQIDIQKFRRNPEAFQKNASGQNLPCISSDDEYFTDSVNLGLDYDATSQSSYSITTEANCDFEFYQNNDIPEDPVKKSDENLNFTLIAEDNSGYGMINENRKTELTTFKQLTQNKRPEGIDNFTEEILARSKDHIPDGRNFRITRSNSKRSLENFHAYVDEEVEGRGTHRMMNRSNSFVTAEDRSKFNFDYQVGNNARNLLLNLNSSIAYLEDMYNYNVQQEDNRQKHRGTSHQQYSGSVPDFKKIFISEYI